MKNIQPSNWRKNYYRNLYERTGMPYAMYVLIKYEKFMLREKLIEATRECAYHSKTSGSVEGAYNVLVKLGIIYEHKLKNKRLSIFAKDISSAELYALLK